MRYGGASLEQKPYVAGQTAALPTAADFAEGLHRRTTNYVWLWEWAPTAEQIRELKAFLDDGGVAVCGVYAEDSFDAWGKGDAPWVGAPCTSYDINHMVTVCGYGTGYYLVANSWGTSYGSNGFLVVDSGYFEKYFSDVMYPLEGTYEPATSYATVQIAHGRRSDFRSLSFSVNGATVWSNSPLPRNAPLGTGSFDVDPRSDWQLAVDLSSAPWGAANAVTARCMDKVTGTAGSIAHFSVRFNGADHVCSATPIAIPDNTGAAAVAAVAVLAPTRIIGVSGDLAFGNVLLGSTSNRAMTIANSGNSALTVSGIAYPGGFAGSWSGGVIAAGRSTNVTVTFSPTAAQGYGGTVAVSSDQTGGVSALEASGAGMAPPSLAIRPASTNVPAEASIRREIDVTANVPWTASSPEPWLAIASGAAGSGNGVVIFGVSANDGTVARTGAITVSGGGWARTCTVTQAGVPAVPVVNRAAVNVRENGEGRFFVALDRAPAFSTTVTVAKVAGGDGDLAVKGGATLVFTPATWNRWKAVTLAAADDADAAGGTATFQVAAPGGAAADVAATELDDDIGENLALASGGSTLSGRKAYNLANVNDGVHMASTNFGYTAWTAAPPGSMTLDLKATATVSRVRVLNWDWDARVHQYAIESSADGVSWSSLADASAGEHRGWEDWPVADRTARYLKITGLSNSVNAIFCVAEWEVYGARSPQALVNRAAVNVRENGEGRFFVALDRAPAFSTTVTVAKVAGGDGDLAVKGGATLVFTPATWNRWKAVTLAAADDADAAGGTATFQVAAPGGAAADVAATELDDDIGENLALASGGSTLSGRKAYNLANVNDGVHMASTNFGYTAWTAAPPGSMTLDLKATATVSRVRVLNWDWDARVHQYAIESSADGVSWSSLADASAGEHRGWEDWPVADRTARYLKITGLSNSVNAIFCVAEWEVYGVRFPQSKRAKSGEIRASEEPSGPETMSAGAVSAGADGVAAAGPWAWARGTGSGWTAVPELVDGDPGTVWTGRAGEEAWAVMVDFGQSLPLQSVDIVYEHQPWPEVGVIGSEDLREWFDLGRVDRWPVSCRAIYFGFPGDGSGVPPALREIEWEEP